MLDFENQYVFLICFLGPISETLMYLVPVPLSLYPLARRLTAHRLQQELLEDAYYLWFLLDYTGKKIMSPFIALQVIIYS
jgi:hypothetical protein